MIKKNHIISFSFNPLLCSIYPPFTFHLTAKAMSDSISTYVSPASGVDTVDEKNILTYRESPEGGRVYKRTLSFLLGAAAQYLGIQDVSVGESVGASFVVNCPLGTDRDLLLGAMRDLMEQKLPLPLKAVERTVAIEQFTKQGQPQTVKRVHFTPEVSVNCYSVQLPESKADNQNCSEYLALQYGCLLPNLGLLDQELMALEFLSDTTLQLFYPQLQDGTFELSRTAEPKLMEAYAKQKIWAGKLNFQTVTDVNQAIIHSKGNMIVQLSEAMHEFQIVNISSKIGGTPGGKLS